jgi:hypothetical protein
MGERPANGIESSAEDGALFNIADFQEATGSLRLEAKGG